MKKLISFFLTLLLILSVTPTNAFASEKDLKLDIVTDVHYSHIDAISPITKSTEENPFGHVKGSGKMIAESGAILAEFLKNAANDDSDFVIFTGDITDTGSLENQTAMVKMLKEFERTSGKTVICSIGNHEKYYIDGNYKDVSENYAQQFKQMYADLGYDRAVAVDPNSASYIADLQGDYRVICIDTNYFDQSRFDWVEQQVLKAKEDGKTLISVTHHSLFAHYTIQVIASTTAVPKEFKLADKFIEWGIRFNFSGHTHDLDIASHANKDGVVYDIASGTLTTNPACYRTAEFNDKNVKINTKYIDSVDYSLIPNGLSQTAETLCKTDFRKYVKTAFSESAKAEYGKFVKADFLCDALKLDPEKDGEIAEIITQVANRVDNAVNMPIYGEDGLEAIAKQYGYELPESDYSNAITVLTEAYATHCSGNENGPSYTPFGKLAINAVSTCLVYGLDSVTPEQYTKLLNFLLSKTDFNFNIPQCLVNVATSTVLKTESIQYILKYVATPIIDDFLNDQSPDDISLTVDNYGNSQEKEIVANIFNSVINKIFSVLVVVFNLVSSILK